MCRNLLRRQATEASAFRADGKTADVKVLTEDKIFTEIADNFVLDESSWDDQKISLKMK